MVHTSRQEFKSKNGIYTDVAEELRSLLDRERDFIANASNLSSLVYHSIPDLNWAGFYLHKDGELILGPFQGKPACVRIKIGKGVCGTAAQLRQPVIVANVHEFPGHIACDSASQSEIVIPLIKEDSLLGVFDVDSPIVGRFDDEDARGLHELIEILIQSTDT